MLRTTGVLQSENLHFVAGQPHQRGKGIKNLENKTCGGRVRKSVGDPHARTENLAVGRAGLTLRKKSTHSTKGESS